MEVFLNCPTTNFGVGTWNFGDGSDDVSGQLSSSHIYTRPGTYTVTFNYSNNEANGCVARYEIPRAIVVKETPKADFTWDQDEILISNPDVNMHNLSTVLTNNSYTWTVQELGTKTGINPVISFPHIGNYRITLLATNFAGCSNEVTKFIEVKNDFNIFIPNSFTPNADGLNDKFMPVFSPYGLDARSYEMQIFDRWGHLIFSTKDPSKGWDGSFENKFDTPIKQDSYIYKIHFKDMDGRIYQKSGSFTLMPN
jgi:gliding motility-associated-like protein